MRFLPEKYRHGKQGLGVALLGLMFPLAAAVVPVQAATPITLEINLNNWIDPVVDAVKESVQRFEKQNPHIKVEVTRRKSSDEFIVRAAGGVVPDVLVWGLSVSDLSEKGLVRPLDSFITPKLKADIFEPMWNNFTWNGRVWGVPGIEHGPRLAFVWNTDFVNDAGLAVSPNAVLSWPEFFSYADKLTVVEPNGNISRIGYDPRNGQNSRLFTIAPLWDAKYFPPKGVPNIAIPELVTMLEMHADRIYNKYPSFKGGTGWYDIAEGKVAVTNLGVYAPGEIRTRNPKMNVTYTWAPSISSRRVQQVSGWSMAIPALAPHPEESFKLIEFLATDVQFQMDLFARSGFLGASKRFMAELANTTRDAGIRWYINSLSAAQVLDAVVPDPFLGRADSAFATAMNKVYNRQEPARSALAEAQRTLAAQLAELGRK